MNKLNNNISLVSDRLKGFIKKNGYPDFDKYVNEQFEYILLSKLNDLRQSNNKVQLKELLASWFQFVSKEINEFALENDTKKELSLLKKKYRNNEWDYIFLLGRLCLSKDSLVQWSDVEGVIAQTLNIIFKQEDNLSFKSKEAKNDFENYLRKGFIIKDSEKQKDDLAIYLLEQLNIFETNFSKYVFNLTNDEIKKKIYYSRAETLLKKLVNLEKINVPQERVDIYSFNYTLDVRYIDWLYNNKVENLAINSWTNVHGICSAMDDDSKLYISQVSKEYFGKEIDSHSAFPKIIFGIDNNIILEPNGKKDAKDPRRIFTKELRRLSNNTNIIKCGKLQDDYDVITIMGHSLNDADYSYFENFFQRIFNNMPSNERKTKIEYYYYGDRTAASAHIQHLIIRYENEHRGKINYTNDLFNYLIDHNQIILKQTPYIC